MLGNYQKYEVNVKFIYEGEVFPGDPDDVYQLAEQEKSFIRGELDALFETAEVKSLTVTPVIGE